MTKNNQTKKFNQRGAMATLLVFLILGVMTLIALGLSAIFIKEVKTSFYDQYSAKAYYAAESGAEYALAQMFKEPSEDDGDVDSETDPLFSGSPMESGAYFEVTWTGGTNVESTGYFGATSRRVKISY